MVANEIMIFYLQIFLSNLPLKIIIFYITDERSLTHLCCSCPKFQVLSSRFSEVYDLLDEQKQRMCEDKIF